MQKKQLQKRLVDACCNGERRVVNECLHDGANPNTPDGHCYPLHMACQEGHFSVVKLLLEKGANPNLKDDHGKGEAALFRVVVPGELRLLKYLIKSGAKINLRREDGDTLLHLACAWGREKAVVEFVSAGAKVNARDSDGRLPSYYAKLYGHSKIAAFLADYGTSNSRRGLTSSARKLKSRGS